MRLATKKQKHSKQKQKKNKKQKINPRTEKYKA